MLQRYVNFHWHVIWLDFFWSGLLYVIICVNAGISIVFLYNLSHILLF